MWEQQFVSRFKDKTLVQRRKEIRDRRSLLKIIYYLVFIIFP